MKSYLQRMGRSLMLPIAVLPAAALLVGIGNWLPQDWFAATFMQAGGSAILNNLALLFAAGLALGMSTDKDGAAALAGVVAFEIPVKMLEPTSIATLLGIKVADVNPAFSSISGNVFIGIIAGLIAAAMYNRFHNVKLPMAVSFFSGKRLVPIMSALVMIFVTLALLFAWPVVYAWLVAFGKFMVGLGWVGAGLYGFFNRLLIPTGLHQALNSVFWFDVAKINDIGNFWSNTGIKGTTGMYMAGFFPIMMFGLPAGAYAIYRNALPERKKEVGSLMLAGAFASFFTGVSEPLEFSFMFVAWPLYVIHAALTGLSLAFAAFMHWTAGFTFSAGLVDYVLSLRVPMANMPLMLLVQGVVMAIIYYTLFNFAIKKFNLMTPGREPIADDIQISSELGDDKYARQAQIVYAALGGKDNLTVVDNCTTRLRLQVKDTSLVNEAALKASGAAGFKVIDKTNIQVVIGTEVQFVADELGKLYEAKVDSISLSNDELQANVDKLNDTANDNDTVVVGHESFYTVADGELMPISDVKDETFAEKMLGDGYAVEPTNGEIYAPVAGKVASIFPTKHAISIMTETGLEVLLHMGIDTVQLEGKPFEVVVSEGDTLKKGDLVSQVDLDAIKAAGKETTMMVVLTNMDKVSDIAFEHLNETVKANEISATVQTK
ncbi:N-acetylglucosamine-specific PTS transporter subunit IIBC [Dellaglioa sp. L3N]